MLSKYNNKLLNGLHKLDSITYDLHKSMACPLQTAVFVTRDTEVLYNANSMKAAYLFMTDRVDYDQRLDTGDKTIQCGRKVDILKAWFKIKKHGWEGLESHANEIADNAQYFKKLIVESKDMLLLNPVETYNICFYYIPHYLQDKVDHKHIDDKMCQ